MELLWIFVGIVLDRLWDRGFDRYTSWLSNRHWVAVNRGLKSIGRLTSRLEVVQTGWSRGAFSEDHVVIELDGVYKIPEDLRTALLEPRRADWAKLGFQDNQQCGVRELRIVRTSDELNSERAHEIQVVAHTYRYFESKATHFEWLGGRSREQLAQWASRATHDSHAKSLPTPLSVGLSVFCEGGKKLVLMRRTASEAAGGHIAAGQLFNAVGENCAPVDAYGGLNEKARLSIFRTASRGLLEEMGLDLRQVKEPPLLHTFCWDRAMLDYKFFGYVICDLPVEEVRHYWHHAPDKSENREFLAIAVHDRAAITRLVRDMLARGNKWSNEAKMCTIMSLLHRRTLSMPGLVEMAG